MWGIFEFLEMFKELKIDAEISIIGKIKNINTKNLQLNIDIF